jgi:hypothetical protein
MARDATIIVCGISGTAERALIVVSRQTVACTGNFLGNPADEDAEPAAPQ